MAHTCPRCDQLCHCNGDIDDHESGLGDEICTKDHDGCTRDDYDDDWDCDDDDWDDDEPLL